MKGRQLTWPEEPELIEARLNGHVQQKNRAEAVSPGPAFAVTGGLLLYGQQTPRLNMKFVGIPFIHNKILQCFCWTD